MRDPCYIDLEQARQVLAEMGVALNPRQMKRAADKDALAWIIHSGYEHAV